MPRPSTDHADRPIAMRSGVRLRFAWAVTLAVLALGCRSKPATPPDGGLSAKAEAAAPSTAAMRRDLLHAAGFGNTADAQALLKAGADPDARAKDAVGRTALILAASGGHLDIVNALVASGATVGERDRSGHTALNWAAMRGRTDVVTALLRKGADIDTQDNGGVSPLLYAVGTQNVPMVELLVAEGANLEAESRDNKMTPLLLAIEHADLATAGVLLDGGASVNGTNRDGLSPLMAAAEKGQVELVELLLSRGADDKARDTKGRTALMFARKKGHGDVVKLLKTK